MSQPEMMRGPTGGQLSDSSRQQANSDFLRPQSPLANVVGFGHGVKWIDGQATGEAAVLVFVTQKVPESQLPERDVIPRVMDDGTPTDVIAVGHVAAQRQQQRRASGRSEDRGASYQPDGSVAEQLAGLSQPLLEELSGLGQFEPQLLKRRMRPCPSGFSVGNVRVTAGTLGSVVYDFLPGATVDPPGPGLGTPSKFYILSNNHVLADSNRAQLGSPILQPGTFDGGTDPADRIATLDRFIPIQFAPQTPVERHNNVVDCALGAVEFQDATREQYFSGAPRAWRRKANVAVGDLVKKTGRTTNISFGRIIATDATIDVGYGTAGTARFKDQILTTAISAGGDSGSLVTSLDNVATGLLFAGSSVVTVANHIENVRALLRVEIAEQLA
ncbi:S1 family peptidase [Streptomyces fulvoviolaceus]|uniref:S1 family peptidase n=1 Tax=Streptomyces fulvoviolaceus TaxID=285535 RepID=UPI001F1D3A72|nr:S1 family peptidase [Streptomyces fulvoviolaceus]MCT9080497.1 S1 family peptidase [Streptomyces fulvoviolaceus]